VLLKGKESSRLLAYDYHNHSIAWEKIISDNFAQKSGEPVIINNIIYLVSNRMGGSLETTLYGFDVVTGGQRFISEFSRNNNKMISAKLLKQYNNITSDSSSILVLINTITHSNVGPKKLVLLNASNGDVKWEAELNTFYSLDGVSLNNWSDGGSDYIIVRGDEDLLTIEATTGQIIARHKFENRLEMKKWNSNTLHVSENEISLWGPMINKLWTYTSTSKISSNIARIFEDNEQIDPLVLIGAEDGFLRALNVDAGWFSWNLERWAIQLNASPKRIWSHNERVFCLTAQDSLFTLDANSGLKINSIQLDQHDYWAYTKNNLNNAMILRNDHFIVGIDPLNGNKLWKIKEASDTRMIKIFDNNVIVTNKVIEDSVIIINNYNRNNGNLIWTEVLDRRQALQKLAVDNSALYFTGILYDYMDDMAGFFHYIENLNGVPLLITNNTIRKIDIESHHESNMVETGTIKLHLARSYRAKNNIQLAINEYNDLLRNFDQMNLEGHKELAELYTGAEMYREAITTLLNYHNLLIPGTKDAYGAINNMKEISALSWIHHTNLEEDKEINLLQDENTIYEISNKNIEMYRTNSGALLKTIDLDKNVVRLIRASVDDKNLLILIARIETKKMEWGKEVMDADNYNLNYSQYNLLTVNKQAGEIESNIALEIPSNHNLQDMLIKNKSVIITSVFDENMYVWNYSINTDQMAWSHVFESSDFYKLNAGLDPFFYDKNVVIPLLDRIININYQSGIIESEFIDDSIDEIVVCNKNGLIDNNLIIVIDDLGDYKYLTLDLNDNNNIIYQNEFNVNNPVFTEKIDNCFINLDYKNMTAYCLNKNNGSLNKKWTIDLSWLPNYMGLINENLIFLDNENNQIISISSNNGTKKNSFPLLWPSQQYNISSNNIVVYSNRLLYVIKI